MLPPAPPRPPLDIAVFKKGNGNGPGMPSPSEYVESTDSYLSYCGLPEFGLLVAAAAKGETGGLLPLLIGLAGRFSRRLLSGLGG